MTHFFFLPLKRGPKTGLALLLALLLAGPASVSAQAESYQEIVINEGDTLWGIANRYLKDPRRWPDIVRHNNLNTADPTVALPGTRIRVPVELIRDEYRQAQLINLIPEVRYRRKGTEQWQIANADMTLHYEDSLRTMKGAQARVRFPSRDIVQINENTYVVLKPERILQEVELLSGEVRASRARVIMPHGTVVQPRAGQSDYQARVRDDNTEVVFVYKGMVDVTAQGQTVTVREGFGTEVPKSAPPRQPAPLSSFPDFDAKELTAASAATAPPVRVQGGRVNPAPPTAINRPARTSERSRAITSEGILASYRLQVARDENFQTIVFEKTEPIGSTFDIKNAEKIPDGHYWMRVAFIDALGAQGPFSNPTRLEKDTVPPVIGQVLPQEGQRFRGEEAYCDVRGEVTGAVMVSVNEEIVFVSPAGRFNRLIHLKEGANKIVIRARDSHGNESMVKRTVSYSKN